MDILLHPIIRKEIMFDKNKVKDVAKLAMIELNDDDILFYSNEIEDFLKLVKESEKIDLENIKPLYHSPEMALKARTDEVDIDPKNDGINSAPEHDGRHFIVPKVID